MAGLGLGPSATCCAAPFDCTCFAATWPTTLYLTDPVGTIPLTWNSVTSLYFYNGTRSVTAYEYCWSPSTSVQDIWFQYRLQCSGGVLTLDLRDYRCAKLDPNGNAPFTSSYNLIAPFGTACGTTGVNACFSPPSPLVTTPWSLVKYRTSYLHYNTPACVTDAVLVQNASTFNGVLGCYKATGLTPIDVAGTDANFQGAIQPDPGTIGTITSPSSCSSVVNLSFSMSIANVFTSSTVTITS